MIRPVGEGFTPSMGSALAQMRPAATGGASENAQGGAAAAAVAASQNPAAAVQTAAIHTQTQSQSVQAAISQATGKGLRVNVVV